MLTAVLIYYKIPVIIFYLFIYIYVFNSSEHDSILAQMFETIVNI